jgi:hypothetical protein
MDNKKVKQALPGGGGPTSSGRGEDIRKGYKRVNMVEILCTHVWKWKNETGRQGGGIKENGGGGEFNYDMS